MEIIRQILRAIMALLGSDTQNANENKEPLEAEKIEWFFTKAEKRVYDELKQGLDGFEVFAKTRINDIVDAKNRRTYAKIRGMHVDFAIVKQNKIIAVLEVDGRSHESERQKERDSTKNEVMRIAKVKVIRIKNTESANNAIQEIKNLGIGWNEQARNQEK